jgi:hypothetical protein
VSNANAPGFVILLSLISAAWLLLMVLVAGVCTAARAGDARDASAFACAPEPISGPEDAVVVNPPRTRHAAAGARGRTAAGNLAL